MALPDRPAGAGSVPGTGTGRASIAMGAAHGRRAAGASCRDARARFRRTGSERAPPAVLSSPPDSDGRGGSGSARRLRQPRRPDARSLGRETAGDSDPPVDRGRARADRPPVPDRERAPRCRRRRCRSGRRLLADRSAPRPDVPRSRSDRDRRCTERTHARVCGGGHGSHGGVVRPSSGAWRQPDQPADQAETEHIRRPGGRQCVGTSAGRRAGRTPRPPARVGRPVHAHPAETALGRRRFPRGPGARRPGLDRPRISRRAETRAVRGAACALRGVARRAVGQHVDGFARRRALHGCRDGRSRAPGGRRRRAAGLPQLRRPALLRDDGDSGAGGTRFRRHRRRACGRSTSSSVPLWRDASSGMAIRSAGRSSLATRDAGDVRPRRWPPSSGS